MGEIIYHGSDHIIEVPQYGVGSQHNDYGRGFCCTKSLDLAKEYLQEHFGIDVSDYDVVIGYRADDSYFTFAQDFVSGAISLQKLKRAMHLGDLGEQIVLKSSRAFQKIHFVEKIEADAEVYYELKNDRDCRARKAYRSEKNTGSDINELYMINIMRGHIENGDPRLQ